MSRTYTKWVLGDFGDVINDSAPESIYEVRVNYTEGLAGQEVSC